MAGELAISMLFRLFSYSSGLKGQAKYRSIPLNETDTNLANLEEAKLSIPVPNDATPARRRKSLSKRVYLLFLFALFCLSLGFAGGEVIQDRGLIAKWKFTYTHSPQCDSPSYRREWRSLSDDDKSAYLAAVNCLIASPSITKANGDLYNDFPFVHFQQADKGKRSPGIPGGSSPRASLGCNQSEYLFSKKLTHQFFGQYILRLFSFHIIGTFFMHLKPD